MPNTTLLSIITVCYNSEKTIYKTIDSLLKQTINGFEYIIIDGKSTDKTVDIIKSFEDKFKERNINFKWVSETDKGIYDAFNKGIKFAKGDWISFLGSDDYYLDNALEFYKLEINKLKKEVDLVHSVVKVEDIKLIQDKWEWKKFKIRMNIAHVGAFHNKNYFKKFGDYDIKYKIAGDYELLLRAKGNLKTHWFNKVTAIMSEGGISNKQVKNVYLETTKAKIETANRNYAISKLDYYKWIFKYRVKTILNAIIR